MKAAVLQNAANPTAAWELCGMAGAVRHLLPRWNSSKRHWFSSHSSHQGCSQLLRACSNCTFLTVERDAFDEVFGAYFREKLSQAQAFFRANVDL
jgi:hypothetical protein